MRNSHSNSLPVVVQPAFTVAQEPTRHLQAVARIVQTRDRRQALRAGEHRAIMDDLLGCLIICENCHHVIREGEPPPTYGFCSADCRDEVMARRRLVAKMKADLLAYEHLDIFLLRYHGHECDFGKAELLKVASKIGCAWDVEFRAMMDGRDDSLRGLLKEVR